MIKPVNNHILIEPIKHESFISSQKDVYEEVGIVVTFANGLENVQVGMRVYFDSWLAARYPKNDKEDFWLVRWEDVRAIDNEEIPK